MVVGTHWRQVGSGCVKREWSWGSGVGGGQRARDARARETQGPSIIPLRHPSEVFGDFDGEEEVSGEELRDEREPVNS